MKNRAVPTCELILHAYLLGVLLADRAFSDDIVAAAWVVVAPLLGAFHLSRAAVLRLSGLAVIISAVDSHNAELGLTQFASRAALTVMLLVVADMMVRSREQDRRREAADRAEIEESRRQAREASEFYETLLAHTPDAVGIVRVVDNQLRWVVGGNRTARLLGYPDDFFDGRDALSLILDGDRDRLAAHVTSTDGNVYIPARAGGSTSTFRVRAGDGSTRWMTTRMSDMQDDPRIAGLVVVSRDVTEEKAVTARLKELEDGHRELVEVLDEGVMRVGADGSVGFANPRMLMMLGRHRHEVVGADPGQWLHQDDRAAVGEVFTAALGGRRGSGSCTVTRPDGTELPVLMTISPLRDVTGQVTAAIVACTDISALRRAHDEVVQARETAEAAVEARDWLLCQVSHELRTPLTPIMAYSELLIDIADPATVAEASAAIHSAATHLRKIIDDLIDLARFQAGTILDTEPVAVHAAAEEAAALAGVACHISGDATALTDRGRLVQILVNLLANAASHGEPPVTVTISRHGGGNPGGGKTVTITVRDHGTGIAPLDRERVFTPFVQAGDGSRGSGLGLAIVRQLTEAMGGQVGIQDPSDGGGVEVTATLPAAGRDPVLDIRHAPGSERLEMNQVS